MFNLFSSHPHSVGETYWQHMKVSLTFALRLQRAVLASIIHALFPFLCKGTASDCMAKTVALLKKNQRINAFEEKVKRFEQELAAK